MDGSGDSALIVLSDTGLGISAEFLPHVFERFQQADTSAKRIHGGLGLGLSIVRNLVSMHGGKIQVRSDGRNQGTTFTISLPLISVSTPAASVREEPASAIADASEPVEDPDDSIDAPILKGTRVLVVDDQADTRELVKFALEQRGAEVVTCMSASEAIETLSQLRPDVLVSDIGLPGEDGYDLMKKVRSLKAEDGGQTPAVALTGYASTTDALKAQSVGYERHMSKPVDLEELVQSVKALATSESSNTE